MIIGQFNSEVLEAKKESLIQQILSYKRMILEYENLQKQLKTISTVVKEQQNASQQRLSKKCSSTVKSDLTINDETQKSKPNPAQKKINSSHKIKVYELQKKLHRLNKEHNQNFSSFLFEKRQHQVIIQTIEQLKNIIEKQTHQSQKLSKQIKDLGEEQARKDKDLVKCKKQLEQIFNKKKTYDYQKQSYLSKIADTNKAIQSLQQSASCISPELFVNLVNNFNQTHGSIKQSKLSANQMIHQQIQSSERANSGSKKNSQSNISTCKRKPVLVDGIDQNAVDFKSDFDTSFNQNQPDKINQLDSEKLICQTAPTSDKFAFSSRLTPSNYIKRQCNSFSLTHIQQQNPHQQEPSTIFQILKDKLQSLQDYNCQQNQIILNIKKEIISIETEINHHNTNLKLLNKKIELQKQFISRQKAAHFSNLESMEKIRNKLSQKQGQRGQIRGIIGTRVDQQGLLKLVNVSLKKDLCNLKQKTGCLKVYHKMLCGQIIKQK